MSQPAGLVQDLRGAGRVYYRSEERCGGALATRLIFPWLGSAPCQTNKGFPFVSVSYACTSAGGSQRQLSSAGPDYR